MRERKREREHYPSSSMEEDTRVVVYGSTAPRPISQRQRKLIKESLVGEELKRITEVREVWLSRELKRIGREGWIPREKERRQGANRVALIPMV